MTEFPDNDSTRSIRILQPGIIVGQYELKKQLGSGGMGDVYLAQDTLLRREVALKFLKQNLAEDKSFKDRFLREARAAAALNHPNIVTIYEVKESADFSYIAMEYIDGLPLSEITTKGKLDNDQICSIVLQICEGLSAAHGIGLVHRDIKPANIVLDNDNRIRILDFGLAKSNVDQNLTMQGTVIGTMQYMSPEQAQSHPTDHRSDLFSLGILIYELLSGQSPFKKDQPMSTMYSIINDPHPPLISKAEINSSLWQPILNRLLEKNVEKRFASAGELAKEIKAKVSTIHSTITPNISTSPKTRGLAILYLRNAGSPDDEYICYGITEDLIVDLSRIGSLRLAPMRSILRFKDSNEDFELIAEQLDASIVLDGSIMCFGDQIRVSVNLIDIQSNQSLWAKRWEEPLERLSQIKTALAEGISSALHFTTSQVEILRIGEPEAQDHTAYEQYLRARYLFETKQSSSDVEVAIGLYREAIKREDGLLAAHAGLAEILSYQGNHAKALEKLLEILKNAEKKELHPEIAAIHRFIAETYLILTKWDQAWEHAEKACSMFESMGDLTGQSEALTTMISILQPQSRFDELLELFDRLLEICRQQGDQDRTAEALKTMGVVYARRGEYNNAISLYEESLQIATTKKNLSLQAACLSNIGNVEFFKRNLEKAADYYRQSRERYEIIGNSAGSTRQVFNEGTIHCIRANYPSAAKLFKEAVVEFDRVGNRSSLSLALLNLSQAEMQMGKIEESEESANRALEIGREIKRPLVECDGFLRLGDIAFLRGNTESAKKFYNSALDVAEEYNFTRNLSYVFMALADLYYRINDLKQSENYAKKAKRTAKEVDEKSITHLSSAYLSAIACRTGLLNSSLRVIRNSVQELEKQPDPSLEIRVKSLLAEALIECGTSDEHRKEGQLILDQIIELARKLNMASEIRRLEKHSS